MGRHKKIRNTVESEMIKTIESAPEQEAAPATATIEAQEEKEDIDGFLCPICRFKMRVYHTKPLGDCVRRVRICDRCGHKKPTNEK